MNDPLPENISGEKRVSHVVEHKVRWDYMLIGAIALVVIWKVSSFLDSRSSSESDESGEEAATVGEQASEMVEVAVEGKNDGGLLATEV